MNLTNKRYEGRRSARTALVTVRGEFDLGTYTSALSPRFDLANHSPDGFGWGYSGSGPLQLAVAMLADACGDDVARRLKIEFKWAVIANLPRDESWSIPAAEVQDWVRRWDQGEEATIQHKVA